MDTLKTAKIIKQLSEELEETVKELEETKETLKRTRQDSTDWFMMYQSAQKELEQLKKAAEKLNADLPDMENTGCIRVFEGE